MYSQYFGLDSPPFRITPDTEFFYSGAEREALINAIIYAISHGDGIIKVVGEVGSGKTMLSRMLARTLPDNVVIVFLLNPSLQANDLVYIIGRDLGLDIDDECSKNQALTLVQNKLLEMHALHQKVVVFIDEAQCMPLETLEELRLLSNLETETDKLLQLVLFGQPELDEHLAHSSVRQIKERIIHSLYLKPFARAEVGEYLSFRLFKAGYNGSPVFSSGALKLLTRCSAGLPRKLTILADKSMLAAFTQQSKRVDVNHVRLAAADSTEPRGLMSKYSTFVFTVLGIIVLAIGVFYSRPYLETSLVISDFSSAPITQLVEKIPIIHVDTIDVNTPNNKPSLDTVETVLGVQIDPGTVQLETLVDKTRVWLDSSIEAIYTVQILSADKSDDEFLKHFFSNISNAIGLHDLYVHPLIIGDNTVYAVTLGGFVNYEEALQYLNRLPAFIHRYQPYIKNIDSFKKAN